MARHEQEHEDHKHAAGHWENLALSGHVKGAGIIPPGSKDNDSDKWLVTWMDKD